MLRNVLTKTTHYSLKLQRCTLSTSHIRWQPFLSEDYMSEREWEQRLSTPILQKVDIADFAVKIQEKYEKEGQASAIDIDILANKMEELDGYQMDFAQNLLYRFRHTREAKILLDSTPHALIRALIKQGEHSRLLEILKNKIDYGIFLDDYTANMLLDHFIEHKMYKDAAEIACDLMLQEDFAHPISRLLSWYACHLRWKERQTETKDINEEEATNQKDEDDEDTFIPVKYIREPWYDDHFDLPREMQMVGKTLVMVTAEDQDIMAYSYRLLGWGLLEKFSKGIDLMHELLKSDQKALLDKETVSGFIECLSNIVTQEPLQEQPESGMLRMQHLYPRISANEKQAMLEEAQSIVKKLEEADKITECELENKIVVNLKNCVKKVEDSDRSDMQSSFKNWNKQREELLQEQIKRYKEESIRKELTEKLEALKNQEEILSYFEQENKVSLGASKAPEEWKIEDVKVEEQFVASPSERGKTF